MIKYFCDVDLNISEAEILLNNYVCNRKLLVNTLVIITKQYIYSSKCCGNVLNFDHCMAKIGDWYNTEKYLCNNAKKLKNKWSPLFM